MTAYDNLGGAHTINVYFSNEGGGNWEVDAYDASTAAAGGGFPYSSAALATSTLTFNPTTGALTGGSPLTINMPADRRSAWISPMQLSSPRPSALHPPPSTAARPEP